MNRNVIFVEYYVIFRLIKFGCLGDPPKVLWQFWMATTTRNRLLGALFNPQERPSLTTVTTITSRGRLQPAFYSYLSRALRHRSDDWWKASSIGFPLSLTVEVSSTRTTRLVSWSQFNLFFIILIVYWPWVSFVSDWNIWIIAPTRLVH